MKAAVARVVAMAVTGCGQTGPLFLPDDSIETPVEIRGPSEAAAPAEPEDKEKEEEKTAPPPGR
jgi:predicted small lipoprotein YifL